MADKSNDDGFRVDYDRSGRIISVYMPLHAQLDE